MTPQNDPAAPLASAGQRWGLIATLHKQKPAKIARTLALNVLFTLAILVPVATFLGARVKERVVPTADKLPWLRFYEDPATTMYVSWETDTPTNSYVNYGLTPSGGLVQADPSIENVHHVLLPGLLPDTTYYYRVGHNGSGTPVLGGIYSFTTAPLPTAQAAFSFLAISDTQESTMGISHHAAVAEGLAREAEGGARFLLHGGDVADSGADQDEWDYYWKHAGKYSSDLPILAAIGNHDDHSNAPMFRKYFAFRSAGEPLYYSFNYSSLLHVTALKITYGREADFTSTSGAAMMAFLGADLAASAAIPFKVIIFHCPALSSGFFGSNQLVLDNLCPLFDQYNVTVVISGHDHHYERLVLDGTTHLVIGGGGGVLDPCHCVLNETQAVASLPHYVRFHVDPASGMSYEAVTPQGTVFDSANFPLP